jgi:Xaa-Pro aminopeptidase
MNLDNLILRFETIREPISTNELERRWKETRKLMCERSLDVLFIQSQGRYFGGYVRWFIDFPSELYPNTVIFPLEGGMTLITHGSPPLIRPPLWAVEGVDERINVLIVPTVSYFNAVDAEKVVEYVRAKKAKRIGIVGIGTMYASFYKCITQKLSELEIVDATDMIDEIKAVKSEEELRLIQKSATIQDLAMEFAIETVKPGKREVEIMSEIQHAIIDMGSEEQLIRVGSAPPGKAASHQLQHFQNRKVKPGDYILIMIEASGPGGYYTEIGRMIVLGKVPKELEDAWNVAKEVQKLTLKKIAPGANLQEIWSTHREFLKSQGYIPESRIYAHGQGYDIMERPLIRPEETMKLKAGMNLAIHPTAAKENVYAWICENYIVTKTGVSYSLHKTPQEIFCI